MMGKRWIVVMEKGDESVTIEDDGINRLLDRLCERTRQGFEILDVEVEDWMDELVKSGLKSSAVRKP